MAFEIGKLTRLYLGYVGENESRIVDIDVSDWLEQWPDAIIAMTVQRPKEKNTYIPVTEVNGGVLSWTVRREDVAIAGNGMAQIRAIQPSTVRVYMSRVVPTVIAASMTGEIDDGAVPPEFGWVNTVLMAAADAQQSEDDAKGHADRAEAAVADLEQTRADAIADVLQTAETETSKATAAIAQKGADTLASIPEDYTSLAADVGQLSEEISDLIDGNASLKNYLHTENAYIKDGDFPSLEGYNIYAIPCKQGDLITLNDYVDDDMFYRQLAHGYVAHYKQGSSYSVINMNGNYPDHVFNTTDKEHFFIAPENTTHLMISCYAEYDTKVRVLVNGEGNKLNNSNYVSNFDSKCQLEKLGMFRPAYYRKAGSVVYGQLALPYYAILLKLREGDKLTFHNTINGLSFRGTYVGADYASAEISNNTTTFVAPFDCVCFIFSNETTPVDCVYTPVGYSSEEDAKILEGKKIVFFGDSVTYQYRWQPHVLSDLGGEGFNCGIGSTALSGNSDNAFWQAVRLDAVKENDPDIVTILGGANDLVLNPMIGTEANILDKDTSTFIGAYSYIIDNLLSWKPTLEIMILGTTWAHNDGKDLSDTVTYTDFSVASQKVAAYYGLPFVDLHGQCCFNQYTMGDSPYNIYSTDHIHPNDAGGRKIASLIIAKMKECYGK